MHAQVGLPPDEAFIVRMTGCPNGCARPYMAEIGFVGDGPNSYQIYLGGNRGATRLAELFGDRIKVKDLETFLEPVFAHFRDYRRADESLGDFCGRVGMSALKEAQDSYAAKPEPVLAAVGAAATPAAVANGNGNGNGSAPGVSLSLNPATLAALQSAAKAQGKSVDQFLADAAKGAKTTK